jgi:hypothetical protein
MARAKLEAEEGRPVSDVEMMLAAATLLLETRPDGSVPGRSAVNDSHYRVIVVHEKASGRTVVQTAEGPVEVGQQEGAAVLREAGRADLARGADENGGPLVPPELRDAPTTEGMRRRVLARDRYRCLCCGGRRNLTVHHKHWRRHGGRTRPGNLMTLCEGCHSLVHDRLMVIRGSVPEGLRFLGSDGRELAGHAAAAGLALPDARAAGAGVDARAAGDGSSLYAFESLPREVDAGWWARHAHLLAWDDRAGTLQFQPGRPDRRLTHVQQAAGLRNVRLCHESLGKEDEM